MKWLKAHAHYDDVHPWEALDIICTIVGNYPTAKQVHDIEDAIKKSYALMKLNLDTCLLA